MAEHTPGPWELAKDFADEIVALAGKRMVAEVHGGRWVGDMANPEYEIPAEVAANARLIAVAPELYDAADELLGALAGIYSHLQKTSPERLVLPIREAGNKLAAAMRKVEADRA